jgi:hypothetical protein
VGTGGRRFAGRAIGCQPFVSLASGSSRTGARFIAKRRAKIGRPLANSRGAKAIYQMSICRVCNEGASCGSKLMSRILKPSPDERPDASFRRVLADVRRAATRQGGLAREDGELANFSPNLMASAIFPVDDNRRRTTGGASHWHAALAWIEEQDEPTALVELQHPADESAEAILDELGLSEDLTDEELTRLRRLYMWRNHPDRHRESHRASATRRVAIANMLVDRARSRLIGNRRS